MRQPRRLALHSGALRAPPARRPVLPDHRNRFDFDEQLRYGETGDDEQPGGRKPKGALKGARKHPRAPWHDTRRNRAGQSRAKEFRPDGNGRAAQHEGD